MGKPSWIGTTLKGRYRIDELLGQGGMSAVYKATDPNLKRVVALKLIHSHLADNAQFLTRFEEEAASVAKLRHPNIVQVYDFDHDDDTYFMVLEFVPGESLNDRLKRLNQAKRQLDLGEALQILAQVCDAVEYAHKRGLVHRDIKPANIMLDVTGQAILMDFGIVKIVGGDKHTATGAVVGTALYMSPEQIRGEPAEPRSDIYALGVTLFEMLSGKPPFQADSVMTILMMHLTDPVPDMNDLRSGLPGEVVAIINKAMAKNAQDRYQSAQEMGQALRSALGRLQTRHIPVQNQAQPADEATVVEESSTVVEESPLVLQEHVVKAKDDAAPTSDSSTLVEPAGAAPPKMPDIVRPTSKPVEQTAIEDTGPMQPIRQPPGGLPGEAQRAIVAPPAGASQSGLHAARQSGSRAAVSQATVNAETRRALPWLWIAGGGVGVFALLAVITFIVLFSLNRGDDGTSQAALAAQATETAAAVQAVVVESPTPEVPPTDVPTPTQAINATPTLEPYPTETLPPTETPTATVPPGIPYVRINSITLDENYRYVVAYETFEYTEQLPGMHVHFFFNTVKPEDAGMPGSGPWILYGGPRPFTGYTVSDKPAAATQMCALVANANHSIQLGSGNCVDLP